MGRGLRSRAAAMALVAGLVATACSGAAPANPSGNSGSPAAVRLPATPTELPAFTPETFRQLLANLRGTPVVVNFWASWCGPCTLEAPGLAAKAREYEGKVQFLGVDIVDRRTPAREFIERFGWKYPSVFDATGSIRDSLGLIGQPHTLIYDSAGNRVLVWSGAISEDLLDEHLRPLASP